MESLSTQLQSSEIKVRAAALDAVLVRLRSGKPFGHDIKPDLLVRFMSNCISVLKDANPKLVMNGLDCVQLLLDSFADAFAPLINMTFELLFSKYCDSKMSIRSRATEVMVGLANMLGLAPSFEKLAQHLGHKNFRVKEHILFTVLLLHQTYGDEVVLVIPNLAPRLAALLSDHTESVRLLAIDTLAMLHTVLGDQMLLDLEAAGVRTTQLRLIQEAVRGGGYTQALQAMGSIGSASLSGASAGSSLAQGAHNHSPISTHSSKESFGLDDGPSSHGSGVAAVRAGTAGSSNVSGRSRAAVTVPLARERAGSSTAQRIIGASTTHHPSQSASLTPFDSAAGGMYMYHPASFIGLLNEGAAARPTSLYSEKDLNKAFALVSQGLAKVDDWQARTTALGALQNIAHGDGMEFEGAFVALLRGSHEIITAQIADLRSSVSKEACRTVAVLARAMGPAFAPFAEMWIPALMKQVVLKIQVMASAADRSIRIILSTTTTGFPKVLPLLMDQCASKTAALRKSALEYICLSCAVWRPEALEGRLAAIKQTMRTSFSDADPGARKTARHLFWVLRGRPLWQATMDVYLAELDPTSQKHIQAELHHPAPELLEVLELLARPVTSSDIDPVQVAKPDEQAKEGREGAHVAARGRASSDPRAEMPAPSRLSRDNGREAGLLSRAQPEPGPVAGPEDEGGPPKRAGPVGPVGLGTTRRMSTMSMQPMRVSAEREPVRPEPALAARTVIISAERTFLSAPSSSSSSSSPSRPGPTASSLLGADFDAPLGERGAPHSLVAASAPAAVPSTSQASRVPQGGALKNVMTGATRVVRPAPRPEEPVAPAARTDAHHKDKADSAAGHETPVVFSAEYLRNMAEDSHWGTRLRCFEAVHQRLQRAAALGDRGGETQVSVELFLDLAAVHLGDAHQKVAGEVLGVLGICIEHFTALGASRLGSVLVALFHRLADRRQQVRDQSNLLLNAVRVSYDPVLVVGALSPRIPEIPERMKTAVMQFLGVVVPHCGSYFANPQNTWAFLGRMAAVLGGAGTKPSVTLVVAGRRLLELVYNTASTVVLGQIAAMPLQQQTCLKRMLETVVPDIDSLVVTVGRAEWRSKPAGGASSLSSAAGAAGGAGRLVVEEDEVFIETAAVVLGGSAGSSPRAPSMQPSPAYSARATSPALSSPRAVHMEPFSVRCPALPCEQPLPYLAAVPVGGGYPAVQAAQWEAAARSPFVAATAAAMAGLSPVAGMLSQPSASLTPRPSAAQASPLALSSSLSFSASTHLPMPSPPATVSPVSAHAYTVPGSLTLTHNPNPAPGSSTLCCGPRGPEAEPLQPSPLPPPSHSLVWLLHAMRPAAGAGDKLEAMREVKRLARAADDAYWAKNCAQILSVLLEAFNPPVSESTGGQSTPAPRQYGLDKDAAAMADAPLTGYTPLIRTLADHGPGSGSENRMPSNGHRPAGSDADIKAHDAPMAAAEAMHNACKVLLLLTKHRSEHVKVRS